MVAKILLHFARVALALLVLPSLIGAAAEKPLKPLVVRVGYFPNITHAQALVARHLARQGRGWFEERLGTNVEVHWFAYNAGPTAMEAIFAKSLDISYVGPNPALNAYMRAQGKEVRVISGATRGGSALVVHQGIQKSAELRGKKIATPQFGNTQDVSCRVWLQGQGFKVGLTGGDVQVMPTPNPDQLDLFKSRRVAGVWTVEPWVSRLELEGNGRILLLDKDAVTTLLVARAGFLNSHRELARKFAAAHGELTTWITTHPEEAQAMVGAELQAQMRRPFPPELLHSAWKRLEFTTEVSLAGLESIASSAQKLGFLKERIPLTALLETP